MANCAVGQRYGSLAACSFLLVKKFLLQGFVFDVLFRKIFPNMVSEVGIAETGSGKTLAFLLPAIVHINAWCLDGAINTFAS